MPYISTGNEPTQIPKVQWEHISYDYPDGFNWTPGTEFHDKIATYILTRATDARAAISTRFGAWQEMDRKLKAYVSPETYAQIHPRHGEEKPCHPLEEARIVFPYTYSMLEGLLTYLTSAFLQDPIFQYEGVEEDDVIGAALMELVVQLHCKKTKVDLSIHTMLRDSLAYGYGVAVPSWVRQFGKRIVRTSDPAAGKIFADDMLFEGNSLDTIDPYMVLADPNVSSVNVQKGEFFGWIDRTNYMELASEENQVDSQHFNVRYLRQRQQARSSLALDSSGNNVPGDRAHSALSSTSPVDVIKMYVTLIPSEWELGDSDYPEKWYFELASDSVIITAHPALYNHGMYPVAIASPEFDGYSAFPIGRMETLHGLQDTLDFLFNSHMTNQRKAVNDMFIVDPFLVNIADLEDPRPGKLIRLRRPAWGRGVSDVIRQLEVNDITRANMQDASFITQWMDRISGADMAMQGVLRQSGPERLTAKEYLGTQQNAMGRLQRLAQAISMQSMQDIATLFAAHTQQFMSEETYVKVTGRHADRLRAQFGEGSVAVMPQDLSINYDILPRDGSIPGSQGAQVMLQMFDLIAGVPELMQLFDVGRIFSYIAAQFGVKNVDDFKRVNSALMPQTMPDQQVMEQEQAGNLVPMRGM